jgi:hypothetical protein
MATWIRIARFRGIYRQEMVQLRHYENDDPPRPRRSFPVPKYKDRHSQSELASDSKLPGDINDDKSPGEDREQPGTGKMSQDSVSPELPESEYAFNFRPDTSSEGSNPKDHKPIPLPARNEGFPKYCIDEFNDPHYLDVYVQYRVVGGLMKFKESDTGNEYHYRQFPGIELEEFGVWSEDYIQQHPTIRTDNVLRPVQRVVPLSPSNASRRPPSNAILVG